MNSRTSTVPAIVLLLGAGLWLYVARLGEVPVYVMHDEVQGALQAHAIASTGRDLSGRRLPMYFTEPEFPPGRDPALIYVTALGLKLLPFSESGVRTPTAIVAVVNVILTFLVAQRLFRSTAMGLVAAGLLLLTPVHFIRGRLVLSPLYTIPFILGWLWSVTRFDEQPSARRLIAGALWLGAGMYTYLGAVVMMPLYLAMTLRLGYVRLGWPAVGKAAAAFAATLVPMALWHLTHPERNAQIVSAYRLEAVPGSPLARWVELYWAFFDPAFLFVSGDPSLTNSTRDAGFFPMAFIILLPIGLAGIVRSRSVPAIAVAAGLATAPLVAMVSGALEMNRLMFAIPFGVITAAYGVDMLWRGPVAARIVCVALLAAVPWQFTKLYSTYFGAYRVASAPWFGGNLGGAMADVITAQPSGGPHVIYISDRIPFARRYWRFTSIKLHRENLIDAPIYVGAPPEDPPPGASLICQSAAADCRSLQASGWQRRSSAVEPDGSRSFDVLVRTPQ